MTSSDIARLRLHNQHIASATPTNNDQLEYPLCSAHAASANHPVFHTT